MSQPTTVRDGRLVERDRHLPSTESSTTAHDLTLLNHEGLGCSFIWTGSVGLPPTCQMPLLCQPWLRYLTERCSWPLTRACASEWSTYCRSAEEVKPMRSMKMAATASAMAAMSLLLSPTVANAASASASSCVQRLSGSDDLVNEYNGIGLYCGSVREVEGAVHINENHPIDDFGADDVNINKCMNNIIAYGRTVAAGPGNSARRIQRPSGGYANIVWRNNSEKVVTMYTGPGRGAASANWAACASFA